jgi:hypothetical protein
MEYFGRLDIASARLNFDSSVFYVKLEFSSLFGSRAACELVQASLLTKRAKTVARLVKKLIESSRDKLSYKWVEPTHEFLAHLPTLHTTHMGIPFPSVSSRAPPGRSRRRPRHCPIHPLSPSLSPSLPCYRHALSIPKCSSLVFSRCTSRQQAQATLRHQFQDEVNRVCKRGSSVVAKDQDLTLLFNCLDSIFFLINFLSDSLIRICLIQFCIH